MKVLILGYIYSPWTMHFVENLLENNYEVWMIHTNKAVDNKKYVSFYRKKGVHLINGIITAEKIREGRANKKYLSILYGHFLQIKNIINAGKYDLINWQYVDSPDLFYVTILKYILRSKVVLSYWGSDLLRIGDRELYSKRRVIKYADFITFDNKDLEIKFKKIYKWAYKVPKETVCFGLSILDIINKKLEDKSFIYLRREWKIPEDKKVIAIGYNGIPEQQHLKVLKEIKKLDVNTKDKIFILLQMTYGGTKEYRKQVGQAVKETGCGYLVIQQFLTDEQVAELRIMTDMFINTQTTDAFSGSVCENLYAGTVLINAKWLKYQEFLEYDFKYLEFDNISEIRQMIKRVLEEKIDVSGNKELVWLLRSWETCIHKWETIYQKVLE